MGLIRKALLYGGIFALGMGACYLSCVDRKYEVVEHCGELYVKHKGTGMMAEVDRDFDIRSSPSRSGDEICPASRDISERIEDAYRALTR
ncbi:hypothetical protein JW898_03075 [Candidatus Woesearchaeota archaeon]|nr:hypothetical protein [Candidatus Woesearchaeota archaeon]